MLQNLSMWLMLPRSQGCTFCVLRFCILFSRVRDRLDGYVNEGCAALLNTPSPARIMLAGSEREVTSCSTFVLTLLIELIT